MNLKLNLLFFLLAIFGIAVFSQNLNAENIISNKTIIINGLVVSSIQEWRLLEKIEEGKKLLENSLPLRFEEVSKKDNRGKIIKNKGQPVMELVRKEIALAVLDTETGEVFEKRYWLNVTEINKANELRKKYLNNPDKLPRLQSSNVGEEFLAVSNWWNSFNSDISITRDGTVGDRYAVAANKYLMSNDDLVYPEERTGAKYSDIVYVPHSKHIQNLMVIASGKDFINTSVQQAFDGLAQAGIMSRAFPGRLIVDTISPTFVKNILINEQSDPKLTLASSDDAKYQAERVLVRYGANKEKAFRYTVSKTGASGPAQIMPSTYSSPKKKTGVLQAYIGANLIKDVDIGRVDMVNAIKAQILVFDDHMVYVIDKVNRSGSRAKKVFASLSQDQLDEVRAMIYNGGPNKYNTATGGLNLRVKGVKETLPFVQKFRAIRELNLFN
ncbi:MAG: hypothetical protein A2915_01470 [Candidatus Yanofskybacteria bacterium RIFCSPLOWO2_01_FULL_41_34]|uniref:Uncharacterized protein n=1 Tax=Candidatus Yanofskybacteria bacterium RIFCSPHIGHO2_01_FULL_41_26 TaxID=1802661 RepID=A0A1F8EB93_9BACT|nr:MAG: hypothetical protein A2649_01945 [Candidatus Yanofskybacteria bacterium RIFCSPHIGHO2_01_FULL_41_26]OGN21899.1 MAG: hypothetical protein A2915_01470 [Candidatus Yanofskybacteria bacterium RIFCSPLOWO2_01_FULL_41_34]